MQEIASLLSSRPAVATDEPFLLELYASTRAEELSILNWSEPQKEAFIKMQFEAQRRCYPPADHQIIFLQKRPVGRMLIKRSEDAFQIIDISLLPEARNTGIGAHLISKLLKEAAAVGKPVKLHVMAGNPARRLYERLGFIRIEEQSTNSGNQVYLEMIWTPTAPRQLGQFLFI